jgi:hypothetical protein
MYSRATITILGLYIKICVIFGLSALTSTLLNIRGDIRIIQVWDSIKASFVLNVINQS